MEHDKKYYVVFHYIYIMQHYTMLFYFHVLLDYGTTTKPTIFYYKYACMYSNIQYLSMLVVYVICYIILYMLCVICYMLFMLLKSLPRFQDI